MGLFDVPIFENCDASGYPRVIAQPQSFPPTRKIRVDLKPSDAVRIPQSGEWVYSRSPHRRNPRDLDLIYRFGGRIGKVSPSLAVIAGGFV